MAKNVSYCYFIMIGTTLAAASPIPVPVSLHMIILALAIIYIGSTNSTTMGEGEDEDKPEVMQSKDAYMFPVIGSVVLGSLYLVFKYLPKEYVNYMVKFYFFCLGIVILGQKFAQISKTVMSEETVKQLTETKYTIVVPSYLASKTPEQNGGKPETWVNTHLHFIGYAISSCVAVWYLYSNHWAASNIFGAAFSIQGIEMLNLGSYRNGLVLLSGLFFYDIFWVFGTEVMVTVAKSFDAPIKLLFPQMWEGRPSMLGLGDIVIPGIFIALCLRFDIKQKDENRTYFKTVMVSYFLGLVTTVSVMYYFKAAQPALLYLVPACLGSTLLCALHRGELSTLLAYEEEQDDKKDEKETEPKKDQ